MSDIVERAIAAFTALEVEADNPDALDARGTLHLIFNLIQAVALMPELASEITSLRDELKWVNA